MAPDILLIGTGITSAITAAHLQKILPKAKISLWDKARGVGGRMSRSVSPKDSRCSADLGAQYITTNTENIRKYECIYYPLINENVIECLTATILGMRSCPDNARHFVAPDGMNSIVKYFLRNISRENIKFGSKVTVIEEENGKLNVSSEKEAFCSVDVIVSTLPIPQFLQLSGSVKNFANIEELKSVTYSSRFVLVLFYDRNVKFPTTNWACQYLDHEVFRYVSIDNLKRNRPLEPVAVIFHTSVKFGSDNLEMTLPEMENILLNYVKEMFPDWPEPSSTKCHKWRFSQIVKHFEGKPGCLVLTKTPTLILGGDAFCESNFDGCIYSALKVVEAIQEIWRS